ncbi:MAG TPA: DUF1294 domain-containing protein [Planctomycetota bacterium]|nr:DUF1294 domain-containing protein [Planctomycetota bacterium]
MGRVLLAINALAFLACAVDKLLAIRHRRRIAESTLLTLGALGGGPGLWAGMILFRHKTSKPAFLVGATLGLVSSLVLIAVLRRGI